MIYNFGGGQGNGEPRFGETASSRSWINRRPLISFVTDRPGHDRRYAHRFDLQSARAEMETAPQFRSRP